MGSFLPTTLPGGAVGVQAGPAWDFGGGESGGFRPDPDLDELALRVAGRYLPGKTLAPAELKAWVDENRKGLFFTVVGGFKWVVDEHAKKDAAK